MPVDSHVQMPASIMRGFFIKGKKRETFSLDLTKNKVDPVVIKDYGIIYGYFEDDAEDLLSIEETEFGKVKSKIIDAIKKGVQFQFTDDDLVKVKRFITYTITRRKDMPFMVQYKSDYSNILGLRVSPSKPIYNTKDMYPNGEFLDGFKFSLIINSADDKFVCPENCLYSPRVKSLNKLTGKTNSKVVIFPITPIIALMMSEDNFDEIEIDNNEAINELNEDALKSVILSNSTFIISATKEELDKLKLVCENPDFIKEVSCQKFINALGFVKIEDYNSVFTNQELSMLEEAYQKNGLDDSLRKKYEQYKRLNLK